MGGGTVVRVDFDVGIDVLILGLYGGVAGASGRRGGHGCCGSALVYLLLLLVVMVVVGGEQGR